MKGLLYGVRPEPWDAPDESNPLLVGLARTPMRLVDLDEPHPARPEWVMARTRLTGICGSDAKQVFMDFGEDNADSPLANLFTFPTILGHEVVADVAELGPGAPGLEVGQRVVLNPWLSCAPRGIDPPCPSCQAGDFSLCWHFTDGPLAAGIHTGTSKDAPGGFADYFPAHDSMLIPVPDAVPDEVAVFADPFAVSLALRDPASTAPGGQGARLRRRARSGPRPPPSCARCTPTSTSWWWHASRPRPTLARRLGATVVAPEPRLALIEAGGGVVRRRAPAGRARVCPWPIPAGSTSSTTPSASPRPSRSASGS